MRIDQDWKPRVFWAQVEGAGDVDTRSDEEASIDAFNAAAPKGEDTTTSGTTSTGATVGGNKKGGGSSSTGNSVANAVTTATTAAKEAKLTKEQKLENKAAKVASAATLQGAQQGVGYAQAAGLSPAQAALMAGQQAGGNYASTYGQSLLGLSQQQIQQQQLKQQQQQFNKQNEQQQFGNWMNLLGTGLSAGAFLLSDENAKTDIKDGYGILERVTRSVPLKSYKYKGDGVERSGVMAQDLEKTPLAHTVVEDGSGQKVVDTAQLTTANTGMISELSKKVDRLAQFFKGGK